MCPIYCEQCTRLRRAAERAIKLELRLIAKFQQAQIDGEPEAARLALALDRARAAKQEAIRVYQEHALAGKPKVFTAGS